MKLTPLPGKGNENLFRRPKTGIIYFKKFRVGRGEICRSTGTDSPTDARVVRDELNVKFFGETAKIKQGKKFCGELWSDWKKRQAIKNRPRTMASIINSEKHLMPYLKNMLPEEVTAQWWETMYVPQKRAEVRVVVSKKGKIRETPQINRKFFNDKKYLSMFSLSLKRDGIIEKTPVFVDVDPPVSPGKVYPDAEIKRLLEHAGPDLNLQILMAVTMGMRVGEIMGMTWDRIDMRARTIHLQAQDTKTKKARTFGFSKPVLMLLEGIDQTSGPLFHSPEDPDKPQGRQGNRTAWTNCKAKAGVTGRFHWLRHTFLTKAFKKSTNPALICNYAGLSLEEAERTYLHFTPEDTRVVSTLVDYGE